MYVDKKKRRQWEAYLDASPLYRRIFTRIRNWIFKRENKKYKWADITGEEPDWITEKISALLTGGLDLPKDLFWRVTWIFYGRYSMYTVKFKKKDNSYIVKRKRRIKHMPMWSQTKEN
jgi:hypothetical protein